MTRTALLQLLDHPTAIAPAEVQELEQLARAFPYCQTAHLLLAKAAHDQGTMLASQRLRRAATYAADRVLLRQLIEQVVEVPEIEIAEPEPATAAVETLVALPPAPPIELPAVQPEPDGAPVAVSIPAQVVVPQPVLVAAPEPEVAAASLAPITEVGAATETSLTESLAAAVAAAEPIISKIQKFNINQAVAPVAESPADTTLEILPAADTDEALVAEELPAESVAENATATPEAATATKEAVEQQETGVSESPELNAEAAIEPAPIGAEEPVALAIGEPVSEATEEVTAAPAPAPAPSPAEPSESALTEPEPAPEVPEPEIPAVAPPVRPPEEAGSARFEYGLQEEPKPAAPLYELPLVDEWASAATPLALAGSDNLALESSEAPSTKPAAPKWTEAAFTGDPTLGYALDEGSRLGFGLGLLTEALLEKIQAEHESTLAHEIVAAPRPAPLPPTEIYFEPDVLLLEHWATHKPVAPPTPSSSELINSFLRRQPRLTRPAMLPPSAGAQADLSVKSTRPEPELATEGLARILARQGKIDRAIEIYQRLMVKQPEKMAYFAAQIQQLQPPA